MKKCSLKAVFKTYGIIEYLFMSVIFAAFVFISFDTIALFNKISYVENFVTGFTLVGLFLIPCIGFTGLKEEKVSTKVVKIIQSYTGVVDKMVWRKF
jgi:hypothetical protein